MKYAAVQGDERHRITAMLATSGELKLQAAALYEFLQKPQIHKFSAWDEARLGIEVSEVALAIFAINRDRAARSAKDLPEGNALTWAIKNLAANWQKHELLRAKKTLNTLPAN